MQISCQKRAIDNAPIVSRLFKFKTPSSSKTFEIWESFVKAKKCPIPVKDIKCPQNPQRTKNVPCKKRANIALHNWKTTSLAKSMPKKLYITGLNVLGTPSENQGSSRLFRDPKTAFKASGIKVAPGRDKKHVKTFLARFMPILLYITGLKRPEGQLQEVCQ